MGNNLLLLFVGWEGVGLCSYLLIGYYNEKKSAGDAAKKAMIVNRIGDVGVLIGMFFLFKYFGTLDFHTGASEVTGILDRTDLATMFTPSIIALITLMLFLGATGKSAQFPLYVWLPDAMEGPTPVSALIHAATMVTAGVYMVSRLHSLFELSDLAMTTIAVIGIATALFAATMGLMQNDIKRVLAYSTVSQLGYMFAACGAGVFAAGMYHVMTHAFLKACLFLGSGSVIHAIEHGMHHKHEANHDEHAAEGEEGHVVKAEHTTHETVPVGGPDPHDPQDMRNMGGLLKKIPTTAATMIIATLAISGIPLFAGYYSKDEIIWRLWQVTGNTDSAHWIFWGVGALTAVITAFYMFRLVVKTYFGPERSEAAKVAKDSSPAMLIPLVVLAFLSCTTGWAFLKFEQFQDFLAPSVSTPHYLNAIHEGNMEAPLGYGLLIGILLSIGACFAAYQGGKKKQLQTPEDRANHAILTPGWLYWVVLNKYFVDEAYNFWFVKLGKAFAGFVSNVLDKKVIDGGLVNGVGWLTQLSAANLRKGQNGFVRSYAFTMVIGIVIVLVGCLVGLGRGW
jgi:NADH-quinone oxidoreductase subunit L